MFCWGHEGRTAQPPKAHCPCTPFWEGAAPPSPACVWSHAAGLNSISSHSQVWAQGVGPGRERAPWLTNQDWYQCPFPTLNSLEALLWWRRPCPLYCVTFPCLTVIHTTQGKECLGAEKQEGSTEGHCPPHPLPQGLSPYGWSEVRLPRSQPAATAQPPSRPRACVSAPEPTSQRTELLLSSEELEYLLCYFLQLKSCL